MLNNYASPSSYGYSSTVQRSLHQSPRRDREDNRIEKLARVFVGWRHWLLSRALAAWRLSLSRTPQAALEPLARLPPYK